MNDESLSTIRGRRRRAVTNVPDVLVSVVPSAHSILSLVRPAVPSVDLRSWLAGNRPMVEALLRERGAVLFRGFDVAGPDEFRAVVAAWSPSLLNYTYGSTPRQRSAAEGVYSSTEYPADQSIPQHNEMSYARAWPDHLWFYSRQPAPEGGATPLTDTRRLTARLDPALVQHFAERKLRYVRNYGLGFDVTWQATFETEDRGEVEAFCREQQIDWHWLDGDRLHTEQVCQAVVEHPATGDRLWFNQAHLFHTSALPPEVSAGFDQSDPLSVPRQVFYGDGEPIESAVLDEVRAAYVSESIREDWELDDVLVFDNLLVAHGRDPYRGPRRVMVAMTNETNGTSRTGQHQGVSR